MAKPLERKSAKLLALILALIMLGSVLVYAFRGGYTTPSREVVYKIEGLKNVLKLLSDSQQVYYLNFKADDPSIQSLINAYWENLAKDPAMRYIRFTEINSMYYVLYNSTYFGYSPYMFLFDVGSSKVFYSYEKKEDYSGVTIKIRRGYGLTENTNPVALGTLDAVMRYVDLLSAQKNMNNSYVLLINKLPDKNYAFFVALFGEYANQTIRLKNSTGKVADFYFEGISLNESGGYDKVVAINFKQNVFFVESNVTEYYKVERYDGLNIAIMHDLNFTKIIGAKPEMRAIMIKLGGNESRG